MAGLTRFNPSQYTPRPYTPNPSGLNAFGLRLPPPPVRPPPAPLPGIPKPPAAMAGGLAPPKPMMPLFNAGDLSAIMARLSQPPPATSGQTSNINQLLSTLQQQVGRSSGRVSVGRPDFSGLDLQQTALIDRLDALMRGEGIEVGDVSSDPEARAFRLARTRERELAQGAAAERLAASGFSGSGDFDATSAQLRERAGEDISRYEAGLTGRRKAEAQRAAISGAQLTMQDLARRAGQETTAYQGRLAEAGLTEQRRATDLSAQMSMLSQLLADQARKDQAEFGRVSNQTARDLALLQAVTGERARLDTLGQNQYQFGVTSGFQQQSLDLQKQLQALQEELLRIQAEREQRQMPPRNIGGGQTPGGGLAPPSGPLPGGTIQLRGWPPPWWYRQPK